MRTLSIALAIALFGPHAVSAGSISPDHPDVLICKVSAKDTMPASNILLFLSGFSEDGVSVYQSLGSSSVTLGFNPDGSRMGPASKICGGKSLPELVEAGMTKDF